MHPTGGIPRVEAQRSHREFVRAAKPECVMMKITHARRLMRNGETFDSYFYPGIDVLTTTTINDTQLNLLPWDHELEIVREMEPTYHIPTDYSDYTSQPDSERLENIRKCMEGTVWMHQQIEDEGLDTAVVPLVKGVTESGRQICYEVCDALDRDVGALYATRYFTAGAGNNINSLVADIEEINEESNIDLFVIGLLSPNYLERLPENVVSAAGQKQWRANIKPRKSTESEIKETYEEIWDEINNAIPGNNQQS